MDIALDIPASAPHASATRVALLTPYNGGNLGDAAIQEALIHNLRKLDSRIELCGVTLHPQKTSTIHHLPCFALAARVITFYTSASSSESLSRSGPVVSGQFYRRLRRLPGISLLRKPWQKLRAITREVHHAVDSYRLLRGIDVLLIAGGGQLDEEWGGSWGHPFALMKWTVAARLAGASVAFLSVGAGLTKSKWTKFFLRTALSMASYRSYRDNGSKEIALAINSEATGAVVPDLAFSLPYACLPWEVSSKLHVGIAPIAYAHEQLWPTPYPEVYDHYIAALAAFITTLLRKEIRVTLFSSASSDEQVFPELRARLEPNLTDAQLQRLTIRSPSSLADLLALLQPVDLVVASRLHALIVSVIAGKPSLAISYDRKVQTLMTDLGQSAYCMDIRSIKAADLLAKFASLTQRGDVIASELAMIRQQYRSSLETQYQLVAQIISRKA